MGRSRVVVMGGLGPRGAPSPEHVIKVLRESDLSPEDMASVLGYYGIDGTEYFDDNGNWKEKL